MGTELKFALLSTSATKIYKKAIFVVILRPVMLGDGVELLSRKSIHV